MTAATATLIPLEAVDPIEIERRRTRRQSVLDVVGGQYERVTPRLSIEDRRKLEQHLTAVRDIEMRLGNAGADLGG